MGRKQMVDKSDYKIYIKRLITILIVNVVSKRYCEVKKVTFGTKSLEQHLLPYLTKGQIKEGN